MENKTIGIYAIFRKSDDKCMYIGQSKQCENRMYHHLNGYSNTPIENKDDYYTDIIEKHGFDSNVFRLEREAFWINVFEPEWNIDKNRTLSEKHKQAIREKLLGKTSGMKGKHHCEESKQKNRESHLGENNGMYGKHHSEESKQKNRESHLGKTPSEETKQKMSKNNGAHRPEVRQKIREGMKGIHKGKHCKVVDGKRIWY
jgi:group I intron endonuclease